MTGRTSASKPTVDIRAKQVITCLPIPTNMFYGMFPLTSCVFNTTEKGYVSVRLTKMRKEGNDCIRFAGEFLDKTHEGIKFDGIYHISEGVPKIYF